MIEAPEAARRRCAEALYASLGFVPVPVPGIEGAGPPQSL
jgi:hypothetical protein